MSLSRPLATWSSLLELKDLLGRQQARQTEQTSVEPRHQPDTGGVNDQEEDHRRSSPTGAEVIPDGSQPIAVERSATRGTARRARSGSKNASAETQRRPQPIPRRTRRSGT